MATCDRCGKKSDYTANFIARKTGVKLTICEDCLDGPDADYFYDCIVKSKLIEVQE